MSTVTEVFGPAAPNPWALKIPRPIVCSNPDLIMGMELEIEGCPLSADTYTRLVSKLGWQVTTDNSLRGANVNTAGNVVDGNAYEFISRPMRAQTLLYSLEEFFAVTKFEKANYSDRTSVHVHVNCTNLTVDQVSTVALLYTVVEEILFGFVGENRENNIYCIPWTQCRMNHDLVRRMADNATDTVRRWQKYTALNLLPLAEHGTVEFRHMDGTSDIKKLTTWVNLIGSIFAYATATELTALIEEIKTLNSTSEYESFFHRVLGDSLPYDDQYRSQLEAGILTAKYGLVNWKRTKKIGLSGGTPDDYEEAPQVAPRARDAARLNTAAFARWDAAPVMPATEPNRFDPWPEVGTEIQLTRDNRLNTTENTFLMNPTNRLMRSYSVRAAGDHNVITITRSPGAGSPVRTVAGNRARQELAEATQRHAAAMQEAMNAMAPRAAQPVAANLYAAPAPRWFDNEDEIVD